MRTNRKKISALLKKTLIKLKLRNLIKDYTLYSNTCFSIWFDLPQKKRIDKLESLILNTICVPNTMFPRWSTVAIVKKYSDCFTFSFPINGDYYYNDVIKLNFKRVWC